MDKLNSVSYAYHYRNLDSAEIYAKRAYQLAGQYDAGKAEALNNMAFVSIVRMNYAQAYRQLTEAMTVTNNQVELLIADIQQMRLCQRMSRNREFHEHREHANASLRRINEERKTLPDRLALRMVYAETEYAIVNSTYYYYVGLDRQSAEALNMINPANDVRRDTAQLLNYYYNVGAGGIITSGSAEEINQKEFDYLLQCYLLASQGHYRYFVANSLEALSEHLLVPDVRNQLIRDNIPAMKFLNAEQYPDSVLACRMVDKALMLFKQYGDVYQISGAYRTLASCHHAIGDHQAALDYLDSALSYSAKINQAPDLVASIREQLSVAYSAVNNKQQSDYNRNIYIDLQEQTRQDRYLEARADRYDRESVQLNLMIGAVIVAIIALLFMLWLFNYLHRKREQNTDLTVLLQPLKDWQQEVSRQTETLEDQCEQISEAYQQNLLHIEHNERLNLENRAKVSLVTSIMPFIDRIIYAVNRLKDDKACEPSLREERMEYIRELTDKINDYNTVLTHWIQLRQGELSLRIESFALQQVFDVIAKGKTAYGIKGVSLQVKPTDIIVKADRVLTIFMLNTLADNACKFTPSGGTIIIQAADHDHYVEISVTDTGIGIAHDQLVHLFDHKIVNGHGFGLMNCKGIIDKYRKISQIFNVCTISATSEKGKGSRFAFRLPKGILRGIMLVLTLVEGLTISANHIAKQVRQDRIMALERPSDDLSRANIFADSAYFSNVNGSFSKTITFADSCLHYLNRHYLKLYHRKHHTLSLFDSSSSLPTEINWYHEGIKTNYNIILDIRNESAVAALALHKWRLYQYNNRLYTQLFKEMSADNTLAEYCRAMQQSENNKRVAMIILLLVLIAILPAYYLLYYRHRLYYRFCMERINSINTILLSDAQPEEKLDKITPLANESYPEQLQYIVSKIRQSLADLITVRQQQFMNIEMAEDEYHRTDMENSNLHVTNSILDNCLSALKHETMYYPSRIRQIADAKDNMESSQLEALYEIVVYYREIYSLLSEQALRQLERVKLHLKHISVSQLLRHYDIASDISVLGDSNMLHYLFEIIIRQSGEKYPPITVSVLDDKYVSFTIKMQKLRLTKEQCQHLFMPHTDNIAYLLCRQIVRDHSEYTNRRGCGIQAEVTPHGGVEIIIILPR